MISAMVTPSASARASIRWRCSSVRYTCVRVADIQHNIQQYATQIKGFERERPASATAQNGHMGAGRCPVILADENRPVSPLRNPDPLRSSAGVPACSTARERERVR